MAMCHQCGDRKAYKMSPRTIRGNGLCHVKYLLGSLPVLAHSSCLGSEKSCSSVG